MEQLSSAQKARSTVPEATRPRSWRRNHLWSSGGRRGLWAGPVILVSL
jgi:hypothetical protein